MAEAKHKETVILRKQTFEKLTSAIEFYVDTVEQATGQLTTAFEQANLEHDVRFLLADIRAARRMIETLLKRVQTEAEAKIV